MVKKKTTKKEAAAAAPKAKIENAVKVPDLLEMLEAGVHFGHERSKRNPKMEPFIFTQRNRVAIIDLEKTQERLQKAVNFVQSVGKQANKEILFVGTKRQSRGIVRQYAESVGMPYVTKRWLGGTLTNFRTILKSVEKLDELKSVVESPAIEKMTKKERSVMRKEIGRLESVLEGLMNIRALPAAVFAIGSHDEKLAVREAKRVGVPVIGITDTNADPSGVDYPIPANDDAVRSLELIVATITEAIKSSRGETKVAQEEPSSVQ